MTGQIIHGKFEVLDEIGHGGMGVVYRARQLSLDRIVALKMLSNRLLGDEEFRERFRQEAKIIARLTHPNILQVFDIYDVEGEDGGICIVMEYLDGNPLRRFMREAGRLPVDQAVAIADQVASGLGYAHRQGIVHRDIKPDNIMMLADQQVKLMDFGIARLRDSPIHTQTGVTMGTPQFMSPEQAAGKSVDPRSDLYSLGVVIYGMLTGELPFTGDSPVAVALKHIQEMPKRPSEVYAAVPPALDALVLKAMAKRPAERYQTGEEFREALAGLSSAVRPAFSGKGNGDETYVTPPVSAELPVSEPLESASVRSLTPVTTPLPERRFNWGWIVAAVPGLLALAIVLVIAMKWRDRMPWRRNPLGMGFVERAPMSQVLARFEKLQADKPGDIRRLIRGRERFLREKAAAEIRRDTRMGRPDSAQSLRDGIERVILPHLTAQQAEQWRRELDQAARPGRRIRNGGEDPLMAGIMNGTLFARLDERIERPDTVLARREFLTASAATERLKNDTITSPPLRVRLTGRAVYSYIASIQHDPENWQYRWGFAQFLDWLTTDRGGRTMRSRGILTAQALQQTLRAKELCTDPATKKEIENTETKLRERVKAFRGEFPPFQRTPRGRGGPRFRERMGPPGGGPGRPRGPAGSLGARPD